MRILMLSQWFQPEPTFKGLPFARALTRLGHEVQVLTGFPNYPGGKLYDGYKIRLLQRETMDGISVVRVPLYPSHDSSGFRRAANYASFALSASLIGPWAVKPADVAYVFHPPVTVGLPAIWLRLLRNIPFVYDIQDLWPDTLAATGMMNSKRVLAMADRWCRFVYKRADRIAVLSPGFKEALCKRGVPEEKIEVIYNWCDDDIATQARDEGLSGELGLSGKFNVVFAGTMGKAQALDAVLDAAAMVRERAPEMRFVFVGGGVDVNRLKGKAEAAKLSNVRFLPRMSVSEIKPVLARADVLLVHLRDTPLFRITIPSKTQAYLAVGRPILMAVPGDAADLVNTASAGVCCAPENARAIAEAALKLYNMPREQLEGMGQRGREFYNRELSLSIGARKYERLFNAVVAERKHR